MNKIFVIGRNRSGTKWISNLLSNHPQIISVKREGAGGILETNLISQYSRKLDITNKEDRTAFEILFKESNFHKTAKVDESKIDFDRFISFHEFLDQYLSLYAENNNAEYWLQKASSIDLPELYRNFPEAHFIIIQRTNIIHNVISSILLRSSELSIKLIIRNVALYWLHRKIENQYKNKTNVFFVDFNDLSNYTSITIENICNTLNINYNSELTHSNYAPNTSFKEGLNKADYYTHSNIYIIKIFSFIISLFPLNLLRGVQYIFQKEKGGFISKSYSIYRATQKRPK